MKRWTAGIFFILANILCDPVSAIAYPKSGNLPNTVVPVARLKVDSGIPAYGMQINQTIAENQSLPPVFASLHISATVEIEFTVGPQGFVESARVYKSSGNPFADQVGLMNVTHVWFGPFTPDMPQKPLSFVVPIILQQRQN